MEPIAKRKKKFVVNVPQPQNFGKGAFRDRPDVRDLNYDKIAASSVPVDWEIGYNVEQELFDKFGITLKIEHQDGSSSCVAQAFSKYAEVLNIVEEKKLVDLSAKSLYERIYLPEGGAYLRDGAKAMVAGINTETEVPSYQGGTPPSEAYMISQTLTVELLEKAKNYSSKEYRSIGSANLDYIASAIRDNWGAVTGMTGDNQGWNNWIVTRPTSSSPWGHAIYLTSFGKDERGKWIGFINSWGSDWGKNGRGRLYVDEYDPATYMWGAWTLIDKPNLNNVGEDMKLVKTDNNPSIYFIKGNKRVMLIDWPTLTALADSFTTITEEEMNGYEDGGTLIWTERIIN